MKKYVLGLIVLLRMGSVARADDAADAAWKKQMENKVDALTQELEKAKLSSTDGNSADNMTASAPLAISPYSFGPAGGKVYGIDKGLSIGGYGELIYQNFQHSTSQGVDVDEARNAQLDLARWVLFMGYRFSDKIFFNSELEVEHANTSKTGEAEAEFAYLDFALSKPLGFRVGEVLLPVGLTNEYHEPTVFHGVLRPDVEEYLIPTTWHENGAGFYGQTGPLAYRGYLVASMRAAADDTVGQDGFQPSIGIHEGQQEGSQSKMHDVAYVQRVDYTGIPGSIVGGSFYYGNTGQGDIDPITGQRLDAPLTLWEAHAQGSYKGWEARALYTQNTLGGVSGINDINGLSGTDSIGQYMWGGYVEVAYNILNLVAPASTQYVSPFFRYERYNTQAKVPDGFTSDPLNDRTVYTLGVNYKPIPRVVLKADYQIRDTHAGSGTGVNQFNLGAGYEF